MKKTTFTILLAFSCRWLAAQCPTADITFSTQGQVDSFPINYPNCSEMDSSITISGSGIVRLDSLYPLKKIGGQLGISETGLSDLSGLNQLDSVISAMVILNNPSLTTLSGLENLQYVGKYGFGDGFGGGEFGFEISGNPLLTSLAGLYKLNATAGCLSISNNSQLNTLAGLSNLVFIGGCYSWSDIGSTWESGLSVSSNPLLITLDGLEKIDSLIALEISGNDMLTSLNGLSNLRSVAYGVSIDYNSSLKSLAGLGKLHQIGGSLSVSGNDSLTTLTGLENLDTLGRCFNATDNLSLTSLDALSGLKFLGVCLLPIHVSQSRVLSLQSNPALSSIDGLANSTFHYFGQWGKVVIQNCPSLSVCQLPNVCEHLESGRPATLSNNAPGCNSVAEVETACMVSIGETPEGEPVIHFSPNPVSDFLQIEINGSEKWDISLYDLRGRLLYRQALSGNQTIEVGDWPAGLYTLRAAAGERVYTGRFVKL